MSKRNPSKKPKAAAPVVSPGDLKNVNDLRAQHDLPPIGMADIQRKIDRPDLLDGIEKCVRERVKAIPTLEHYTLLEMVLGYRFLMEENHRLEDAVDAAHGREAQASEEHTGHMFELEQKRADLQNAYDAISGLEQTVMELRGLLNRTEDQHHAFAKASLGVRHVGQIEMMGNGMPVVVRTLSDERIVEACQCIVGNDLSTDEAITYLTAFVKDCANE